MQELLETSEILRNQQNGPPILQVRQNITDAILCSVILCEDAKLEAVMPHIHTFVRTLSLLARRMHLVKRYSGLSIGTELKILNRLQRS